MAYVSANRFHTEILARIDMARFIAKGELHLRNSKCVYERYQSKRGISAIRLAASLGAAQSMVLSLQVLYEQHRVTALIIEHFIHHIARHQNTKAAGPVAVFFAEFDVAYRGIVGV